MSIHEATHRVRNFLAFLALACAAPSALAICQPQPECEADNTPPYVTLTSPANGATATVPGAFTLSATAGDDSAVGSVEFFSNNVSVGVDSSEPYSVLLSGLAAGSYQLKAKATDDSGKTATSTIATVTVNAPSNSPPTVALTSPTSGATGTAPATFVLAATAADADGTIASVKFKSGGSILYTDTSYPYSYSFSGVAAGSYSFTAVATDNGGATTTSSAVSVTVSVVANAPPTVSLTAPANGSVGQTGNAFNLTATASDGDGSIASVKFLSNGALLYTDTTAPFAHTYMTPTAGTYAITALATDNIGATTTSSAATVTVTNPAPVSETRSFVYDANQRLCKTINPESGATVIDYDVVGNIAWTADGLNLPSTTNCDRGSVTAGQKTIRGYDVMNRLTSLSTPGGTADVVTVYEDDGLVKSVTAANPGGYNVVTEYAYNKRRLLTAETSTNGSTVYVLGYGYTANGHLSALGYPDGQQVTYAPDALGRATQVVAGAQIYASAITYFPGGAISGFTYGNGQVHTLTQNTRRLPLRSRDAKSTLKVALDDTYAYDENGNVTDISDQAQNSLTTRGMAYDGLDRLTAAVSTQQWGNASYTYDALDNLRSANLGARQFRYGYDATFRLADIRNPSGAVAYTFGYDVRGNTTAKNTGTGCAADATLQCASKPSQALAFDAANRLSQVTGVQTYRYDGLGRRVQTTDADGKTTFWIYSQAGQVLHSSEARRSQNISYIYLGNTQVATRTLAWGGGSPAILYQHTDALGTPVAKSNSLGNIVERTSYSPYGEQWSGTPVDGTGYTGHVMDSGSGLTYMQQRFQDPVTGSFASVDPIRTNGNANFNAYRYANSNPFSFTDPDGRVAMGGGSHMGPQNFGIGMDFTMASQSGSGSTGDWAVYGLVSGAGEVNLPEVMANAVRGCTGFCILGSREFGRSLDSLVTSTPEAKQNIDQGVSLGKNLTVIETAQKSVVWTGGSLKANGTGSQFFLFANLRMTAEYSNEGTKYLLPIAEVLVHETGHFREFALRGRVARGIALQNEESDMVRRESERLRNASPPQPGRSNHHDGSIVCVPEGC